MSARSDTALGTGLTHITTNSTTALMSSLTVTFGARRGAIDEGYSSVSSCRPADQHEWTEEHLESLRRDRDEWQEVRDLEFLVNADEILAGTEDEPEEDRLTAANYLTGIDTRGGGAVRSHPAVDCAPTMSGLEIVEMYQTGSYGNNAVEPSPNDVPLPLQPHEIFDEEYDEPYDETVMGIDSFGAPIADEGDTRHCARAVLDGIAEMTANMPEEVFDNVADDILDLCDAYALAPENEVPPWVARLAQDMIEVIREDQDATDATRNEFNLLMRVCKQYEQEMHEQEVRLQAHQEKLPGLKDELSRQLAQ